MHRCIYTHPYGMHVYTHRYRYIDIDIDYRYRYTPDVSRQSKSLLIRKICQEESLTSVKLMRQN